MIAAGDLTERITFERANSIVGPGGKVTTVWTAIATVWAQELDPIAAETADANGVLETGRITYRARYLDITPADRVRHGDSIFNIVSVKKLGRRTGIEIQCEAIYD